MKRCTIPLLIALAGCGDLPRDTEGTLDRVRREHVIRIGHVAGTSPADERDWRRVVAHVAAETQAVPKLVPGTLEPLLLALEAGEVDLVVGGHFDAKTPWKTRVSLGPPLGTIEVPAGRTSAHIVARNGENAWIMLVERASRRAGAGA